ncbi:MAG: polyprenyl diphosphate synthase [Candidatus Caldatribacterium sp.]|nr:polyprenyl diphosphate synthase [Candidatus Caldatribacterium sp.]
MGKEGKRDYERVSALLRHVAIIMDGNGRWAEQRGLPRLEGHRKGVETVRVIVEETGRLGIPFLTLYSFSTESWRRPVKEVHGLLALFEETVKRYGGELKANNVRVRFLGRRDSLPESLKRAMDELEQETARNTGLTLNLALNYGGRDEILRAMRRFWESGKDWSTLSEETFRLFLDTGNQPDPDLLIRTGGEKRISNFLLWQVAYTELWFTDVLWPDFNVLLFHQALEDFAQRRRRFGGLS